MRFVTIFTKLLLAERYRAIELLGQGGFGKTFKAIDEYKPSVPNCVIKQFLPQAQGTNNPLSAPPSVTNGNYLEKKGKQE